MRVRQAWPSLSLGLSGRFMLVSLLVIVLGTLGIGWWVAGQIRTGVIHQSAATTALYVDSFIRPHVEELRETQDLSPASRAALSGLLRDTPLGQQIVAFKLWDGNGRVLFSTDEAMIGETFPMHELLALAVQGQIAAHVSDLQEAENAPQGRDHARLLEIYSPIRLNSMDRIVAVAEFYQTVDDLERELAASQRRSWLIVSGVMLAIYLLLAVFVRQTSRATEALHERVRRAAADSTASNEGFLRRTSAELHDGPIQDIGFALLRLDRVVELAEGDALPAALAAGDASTLTGAGTQGPPAGGSALQPELDSIRASLQRAMGEVRAISRGMSLPQLAELSLEDTARRAVRDHERRTATSVRLRLELLPTPTSTALKMTIYRLLQEGLANAVRHAGGQGQAVSVLQERAVIRLEIMDEGPGFDPQRISHREHHLGLAGMRDRAESLGGTFEVVSAPGRGTRIVARLPLIQEERRNGR